MQLEVEYWDLKARGLQRKAEAIKQKVEGAKNSGGVATAEVLEMEAEADLTLAEVKLCEANAVRIKDALGGASAGILKVGATGTRVESLQRTLNARLTPSPNLNVDGDFGPLTQQAVIKYQRANGLNAAGVVDAATEAALQPAAPPVWNSVATSQSSPWYYGASPPTSPYGPSNPPPPAQSALPTIEIQVLGHEIDSLKAENELLQQRLRELEATHPR